MFHHLLLPKKRKKRKEVISQLPLKKKLQPLMPLKVLMLLRKPQLLMVLRMPRPQPPKELRMLRLPQLKVPRMLRPKIKPLLKDQEMEIAFHLTKMNSMLPKKNMHLLEPLKKKKRQLKRLN
jgi:hypothetical protein